MIRSAKPLPPFKTLARALTQTTETLACELGKPTERAPAWSDLEWRIAEAVAALHGIAALLARDLRWSGPPRWRAFLSAQTDQTVQRRAWIAALLARVDAALRARGIAAVALKGAALYELGLYPGGERPMGDIDLLLADADLARAADALGSLGYSTGFTTWRHQSLDPDQPVSGAAKFGEHIDNPIKIELHTRIVERLPVDEVDITNLEFPRNARPGLNPYPTQVDAMRHLLLHAAGNMRARALRLVQLHDIALLGPRLRDNDWDRLLSEGVGGRGLWWALPPLALTRLYYPASLPERVVDALRAGCPSLLRRAARTQRITDVSWSRLRIQAFPGIEWSTSAIEAIRFIKSRVWPDRAALAELEIGNRVLAYASAAPWYGDSHAVRILRWAFSSPPRVQTIHSVRQALEDRAGAG